MQIYVEIQIIFNKYIIRINKMNLAWGGPCDKLQKSISFLHASNQQLQNIISMILFKFYKNIKYLEINLINMFNNSL